MWAERPGRNANAVVAAHHKWRSPDWHGRRQSIAAFAKIHFEKRTQHLCDGLLDHAIQHRRYAQRTLCPVGLWNEHPAHGRGAVVSFSDRCGNSRPVLPRERGKVRDGHAVDPRSTLVRLHAFPRLGEVFRFKDFLDHVSFLRGSMLPSVTALKRASPSGVIGWLVRGGVDPLLIGSILHRVRPPVSMFKRASSSPRLISTITMISRRRPPGYSGQAADLLADPS